MFLQRLILVVLFALNVAAKVSQNDLNELSVQLWNADTNGATKNQIQVNYQAHTNSRDRVDSSNSKFFTRVDESLLKKPTYESMLELIKAIETNAGSKQIDALATKFINAVSATDVYEVARQFLILNGVQAAKDTNTFKRLLRDLWFTEYNRGGNSRSSGFEHVFVGEVKDNEVSGLHNWVRMYTLEKLGKFDYAGFVVKRDSIGLIQYKWNNVWKPTGSVMIGSSPEYDLSVFTVCFLVKPGEDACQLYMGDCTAVDVTSHEFFDRSSKQNLIGTAFASPARQAGNCPF